MPPSRQREHGGRLHADGTPEVGTREGGRCGAGPGDGASEDTDRVLHPASSIQNPFLFARGSAMKPGVEEVGGERRSRAHRFVATEGLKQLVLAQLPEGHPLREVILAERDVLSSEEFLAKMPV